MTPGEGKVTLTADDNRRGSLRSGKLRITGRERGGITGVSQGNGALILRLEVEAPATVAAIPLHGQVSCTIDWGDGAVESIDAKIDGLGIGILPTSMPRPGLTAYRLAVRCLRSLR